MKATFLLPRFVRTLKRFGGYQVFVYAKRITESLMSDGLKDILTVRPLPSKAMSAGRTKAVESYVVADHIDVLVQVGKSLPGIEGVKERTGCKTVMACHGEPFWQRHVIMHRRQKGFVRRLMWHLWNRRRFEDGTLAMKMAKERTLRDYALNDAYTVLCESYRNEVIKALGLDALFNQTF